LVWFDLVYFDLVWFGLVWFGLVWFGIGCLFDNSRFVLEHRFVTEQRDCSGMIHISGITQRFWILSVVLEHLVFRNISNNEFYEQPFVSESLFARKQL
jgi:hypothetical protein